MTDKSLGLFRRTLLGVILALLVMAAPVAALAEGSLLGADEVTPVQGEAPAALDETTGDPVAVGEAMGDEDPMTDDDAREALLQDDETTSEDENSDETSDDVDATVEPATVEPAEDEGVETTEDTAEDPAEKVEALEVAGSPLPGCPAGATTVDEGTYVLQATLAKALLIEAAGKVPSAGAAVQTAAYTGALNQKWVLRRYQDTNWYRLRLAADKTLALGVEKAASGSAVKAVKVTDPDQAETLWAFVPNSNGTLRLVSASGTTLALSVKGSSKASGAALVLAASKGTANQRISLVSVLPSVEAGTVGLEGAYQLTEKKSGLAITVNGGKKANGTNFQLSEAKGSTSQQIYLEPVDGGGYYVAWVIGTSKVLGVAGGNPLAGANVHQWSYSKSDAQKWAVRKSGDGSFKLYNKATGLALAAEGSSDGANLAGATKGSSFVPKRLALLGAGIVEIKSRKASAVSVGVAKASVKDGASIVLWTDADNLNQRFQLVAAGGTDLWRLRTASSGGWLSVKDGKLSQQGKGATKADATNVWRVTFRGGWYGLMLNDGTERAVSLTGGKTTKGTRLSAVKASGSAAQHLSFEKADLLKPGIYFIKNARGKLLDVHRNTSFPGANVQTYQKQKDLLLGEYFTIEKAGSYVRIRNTYSELCVTASGAKVGANVAMQPASTANSQKWKPQIADGGYIMFKGMGAYKNLALHVAKGSAKNGANVVMGKCAGGVAQRWKLIATTYNPYTGYMIRGIQTANASNSATNYLIVVDRANTHVMIMKRNGAEWRLHRNYPCSCGKPSTPTITGSYTVGSRGYQFTDGDHTCYYWTEISGDYLFHSVLYRAGTMNELDGRVGYHISMGCVRLHIAAAKWIYDNIPSGTKIIIY